MGEELKGKAFGVSMPQSASGGKADLMHQQQTALDAAIKDNEETFAKWRADYVRLTREKVEIMERKSRHTPQTPITERAEASASLLRINNDLAGLDQRFKRAGDDHDVLEVESAKRAEQFKRSLH